MALANMAVAQGWTDQEICNLLVIARHNNKQVEAKGGSYIANTVAKARSDVEAYREMKRAQHAAAAFAPASEDEQEPPAMENSEEPEQADGADYSYEDTEDATEAEPADGTENGEAAEMDDTVHTEPAAAAPPGGDDDGADNDSGSFQDLDDIIGDLTWLVPNYIPKRMLTGLVAQPKVGKSGFAFYALARPIVTGCHWWTGQPGPEEPGYVIYCDTERRAAINLTRAKSWGMPLDSIKTPFKNPLAAINLDNPAHVNQIYQQVERWKAPLVIVDSFRGAHDGDENNSRIKKPLTDLATVAEATGAAIVVIHHAPKLTLGKDMTINAGRGSNAFLAAIAAQIVMDIPDPTANLKTCWRRAKMLGENLGVSPEPFGFCFTETGLQFGLAPGRVKTSPERNEAVCWLVNHMEAGKAYNSGDLIALAVESGYKKHTIQRAATETLGIVPQEIREHGRIVGWTWTRPNL
jgi:hypothetical protein